MDNPERYDAASVIGQMAGLGKSEERPEPVSPEQLVAAFCGEDAAGMVADPGTSETEGVRKSRGWCGYRGGRGDSLSVGFDDGYDFLGYLGDRGWRALAGKGDWPYVVYLATRWEEGYALAEYCEADLTIWRFPDAESYKSHCAELRDAP